jgi:hydrogenase 3 maturation protease
MSRPSWQNLLRQKLASCPSPRLAILGIGNELRGDDAAGVIIAQQLLTHRDASATVCVIEAGAAPEAFTGRLRRFDPDLVLMIDAAQMDQPPGTICLIGWQDTIGLSASTHTLPLNIIAQYLVTELGCDVAVIGIQPCANAFDTPLSPAVRRAVEEVVRGLMQEIEDRRQEAEDKRQDSCIVHLAPCLLSSVSCLLPSVSCLLSPVSLYSTERS